MKYVFFLMSFIYAMIVMFFLFAELPANIDNISKAIILIAASFGWICYLGLAINHKKITSNE